MKRIYITRERVGTRQRLRHAGGVEGGRAGAASQQAGREVRCATLPRFMPHLWGSTQK